MYNSRIVYAFLIVLLSSSTAFAQTQTAGGLQKSVSDIEDNFKLEKKIKIQETERSEKVVSEDKAVVRPDEKRFYIEKINVNGSLILSGNVIDSIIEKYEARELSFTEIKSIAHKITEEYRNAGYVTSRAYVPKQSIKDGILDIEIIEGHLGRISYEGDIKTNKTRLMRRSGIYPGKYFNYSDIQKALKELNKNRDRTVKAVLVPGEEKDTTDVVFKVVEGNPLHISVGYDNYGSRYLEKNRYSLTLEHTNVTGNDDVLEISYQRSDDNLYEMVRISYAYELATDLELGIHALNSETRLGEELYNSKIEGDSKIAGIYLKKKVIDDYSKSVSVSTGFDYKHVQNLALDSKTTRDEVRAVKIGADIDINDKTGRTIITSELSQGIPHIMGAASSKDPYASRFGAGSKFTKFSSNLYRLQALPFDMSLLWKNSFQYSNHVLLSSEQFQIGGLANVRGYASGEHSGDKGLSSSLELNFPVWGLSKRIKFPFSKASLYDSFRLVAFYDWATVHRNVALPGEKKHETLRGSGVGLRFTLPEEFSLRLDVAWAGSREASDDKDYRTYLSVQKRF